MIDIATKFTKINGLDVLYYTAGRGEPIVVIHGGGGDARTWSRNITELAEKYTVYAPDLPGYGGSEPLVGDYYIPELVEFVEAFTKSLGLKKFYLMGHSLGGGIALNFALKFPDKIKKLVLISSLCLGSEIAFWVRLFSLPAIIKTIGGLFMALMRGISWVAEQLNPARYIMALSPAAVTVGTSISTFHEQTLSLEERLPEVKMPTLVIWGAHDPIVPVMQAYRAAKVIPDCRVEVFKHQGHNVHRNELKKVTSLLTNFLL